MRVRCCRRRWSLETGCYRPVCTLCSICSSWHSRRPSRRPSRCRLAVQRATRTTVGGSRCVALPTGYSATGRCQQTPVFDCTWSSRSRPHHCRRNRDHFPRRNSPPNWTCNRKPTATAIETFRKRWPLSACVCGLHGYTSHSTVQYNVLTTKSQQLTHSNTTQFSDTQVPRLFALIRTTVTKTIRQWLHRFIIIAY